MKRPKRAGQSFTWTPSNVTTRNIPRMILRTYIEWQQLEDLLAPLNLFSACDVGCGFGRMSIGLTDYVAEIHAVERERGLIEQAHKILPEVWFHHVDSLLHLPLEDEQVQLSMTFTVLQHMSDQDAKAVIEEMKRVSSRYILIVEETDTGHHYVDPKNKAHFTHGRSVEAYSRLLEPFLRRETVERVVEPGFKYQGTLRESVGHYMLFEKEPPKRNRTVRCEACGTFNEDDPEFGTCYRCGGKLP